MARPMVSVLMSVYNGQRYLREAVESILNQTFSDFEFIIVNDGSTDTSRAILQSYDDSRILLLDNHENIGLARSVNKGLAVAKGDYVARMDADDISMPRRFEKQVAFLKDQPEVGIVGCSYDKADSNGRYWGSRRMPASDLELRWYSLLGNPFAHPSVMIRRHTLIDNNLKYDETLETTQDYDLWTRILRCTRGANLGEALLQYRFCDGITSKRRATQLKIHDAIAFRTIREQLPGFVFSLEQVSKVRGLFVGSSKFTPELSREPVTLANLYLDMFQVFLSRHPEEPDRRVLQRQVARMVGRRVLFSPRQPGRTGLVKRLVTLYPTCLFTFVLWSLSPRNASSSLR